MLDIEYFEMLHRGVQGYESRYVLVDVLEMTVGDEAASQLSMPVS